MVKRRVVKRPVIKRRPVQSAAFPIDTRLHPALAEQRARFREELNTTPELRLRWAALMISEQSGAAMQTVGETMVNRANAWGVSLSDIVNNERYYAPHQNKSFHRHLAALARDETRLQRIYAMQDGILDGSNRSNLATHNASAHVAVRARRTQTVCHMENGETYTRKDKNPAEHGAGVIAREKAWHRRTLEAMRENPPQ